MTAERTIDSRHNQPPSEAEIIGQKLAENYALENDMAKSLAERELPETVNDEKEAGKIADFLKAVVAHQSTLKEIHKREKDPFLRAGQTADAWLREHIEALDAIKKRALKLSDDYLDRKEEAERQRLAEIVKAEREKAAAFEAQALAHADAGIQDTADDLYAASEQTHLKADMIQNHAIHAAPKQLATARGSTGTVSRSMVWAGEVENKAAIDLNRLSAYLSEKELQRMIDAYVKSGGRDLPGVKIHQVAQAKFRSR